MPHCGVIPREFAGSYAVGREPVLERNACRASDNSEVKWWKPVFRKRSCLVKQLELQSIQFGSIAL
jgi:hypothetical protein